MSLFGRSKWPQPRIPRPWPTELRLAKDRKALTVTFDTGESFALDAEYLRVMSPSAEVQGHSPDERKTQPGKRRSRSWRCIRSAITRCGWCSTTCTPPASTAGTISARARAQPRAPMAGISRRARQQGAQPRSAEAEIGRNHKTKFGGPVKLPHRRQFLHLTAGAVALPVVSSGLGRNPIRRGRCAGS